ncbi:MAG: ribosome biogenesis GTP-binding protein YihA/YsxC [Clostridiales bacterium]|jgi:GTP-binding protein|nr:ribosome biogenesis GTP-binding protein YihA/YsxC [Clostridiales bacterium]MDR2713196.1 ribosome biogenesis GTP-binding protein YihA/YsxC [Clostridiales bacterium]
MTTTPSEIKIIYSELAASAVNPSQYPEPLPEIVLLGRSNVGKSSLINTLMGRKSLARTSSQPGKTRLINFYRVQAKQDNQTLCWYFVDLPGYGYAKASKTEREKWLVMIEDYLQDRQEDKQCFQLLDIRHAPSQQDILLRQSLLGAGYTLHPIATKADKISRGARGKQIALLARTLELKPTDITIFSATTKEGREPLLAEIWKFIENFTLSSPPSFRA